MTTTKLGRPRSLDIKQAATIAMNLFWERGYETVGIADLTKAMSIKPPSLYAAFGNKAGLLEKALEQYQSQEGKNFKPAFDAKTKEEFIKKLFSTAANSYTKHKTLKGCLVLEGTRNTADKTALEISTRFVLSTHEAISEKLSQLNVENNLTIADLCITVLFGLSAYAKAGISRERLQAVAHKMSEGIVININ